MNHTPDRPCSPAPTFDYDSLSPAERARVQRGYQVARRRRLRALLAGRFPTELAALAVMSREDRRALARLTRREIKWGDRQIRRAEYPRRVVPFARLIRPRSFGSRPRSPRFAPRSGSSSSGASSGGGGDGDGDPPPDPDALRRAILQHVVREMRDRLEEAADDEITIVTAQADDLLVVRYPVDSADVATLRATLEAANPHAAADLETFFAPQPETFAVVVADAGGCFLARVARQTLTEVNVSSAARPELEQDDPLDAQRPRACAACGSPFHDHLGSALLRRLRGRSS